MAFDLKKYIGTMFPGPPEKPPTPSVIEQILARQEAIKAPQEPKK
jgi:hypothetical protein